MKVEWIASWDYITILLNSAIRNKKEWVHMDDDDDDYV
jgi:hypothetical protein